MKPVFFFLVCLLLAGCQCLPSGDPPPGEIVENPPSQVQSSEAAENRLVTSLSAYLLQHPPADGVTVEADAATAGPAYRVMRGVRSISGVTMRPGSNWVLRTRGEGNLWLFQLFDRSRTAVLWQDRVAIAGEGASNE